MYSLITSDIGTAEISRRRIAKDLYSISSYTYIKLRTPPHQSRAISRNIIML